MYDDVVSTGTLAAASFETVGYAYQELIIAELGQYIILLASLVFAVAFGYTMFSFATGGRAKDFLWYLIGPGIFFFLLFTQVESSGAVWQFGTFDDLDDGNDSVITSQLELSREQYSVSWAFHRYNKLISSIYRELIAMVTSFDSRTVQLSFGQRVTMVEEMFAAEIEDPGLNDLIQRYAVGEACSESFQAIREIGARRNSLKFRSGDIDEAAIKAANDFFNRRVTINPAGQAGKYLTRLFDTHRTAGLTTSQPLVSRYCAELEFRHSEAAESATTANEVLPASAARDAEMLSSATCAQVWCWTALGLHDHAESIICNSTSDIPTNPGEPSCDEFADMTPAQIDARTDSSLALRMLRDIRAKTTSDTRPTGVIGNDVSEIASIVAGSLLRKAVMEEETSSTLGRIAENTGFQTTPYRFSLSPGEDSRFQQALHTADYQVSTGLKYDTYYMLMMMPYVQGVILYGLAALFPFFCLVAVFPGFHGTIIRFCLLWAWVKSWDVGFACVMMADQVLWNLMPHFAVFDPGVDPTHGAVSILESAFDSDPTHSLSTYYMLLSTMLTAVPVLTANALLGARSAMGQIAVSAASKLGGVASRRAKSSGMHGVVGTEALMEADRLNDGRAYLQPNRGPR